MWQKFWNCSRAALSFLFIATVLAADPTTQSKDQSLPTADTAARVKAKQDQKPAGLAGVGLTPQQVNEAIDRGSEFLWNHLKTEHLQKNGQALGDDQEHVLACLALVHAGAHKRFPDFDAALRSYLQRGRSTFRDGLYVYEAGLYCMLVEAYGDPTFLPELRQVARYLVEAQGPGGTWDYHPSVPAEAFDVDAQDLAKPLRALGGRPLEGPGSGPEQWKRRTEWGEVGADGDNSVTQYALLGLWAVSRLGIKPPEEVWKRYLAAYRDRQNPDGGWGYSTAASYGSMACSGICGLAINRHELGETEPGVDEGVERGLAWLAGNFTVEINPKYPSQYHYYYLYSLERVGQVLGTEFIGPHEWYPLGAKFLVGAQKEDGRWMSVADSRKPVIPTSFALLFLKRATPGLKMEIKRGGQGTLKAVAMAKPSRFYVILDCSGSMLFEMGGRQKFQIARDAVAALVKELPDEVEIGLRVYGHRKRGQEDGASEDTELLIPPGKLDRRSFSTKLDGLRARGKTPLARSLRESMRNLSDATAEKPTTVILLTDGGEDTRPMQDPIKVAAEFGELANVKLHVVGFDVGREDWVEQLNAMVRRAGGRYYPAADGEALLRKLRASVFGRPEQFALTDANGRDAGGGNFGESKTLPEGKYRMHTRFAGQTFEQEFWINTEVTTALVFDVAKVPAAPPSPAVPPHREEPPSLTRSFCTACGTDHRCVLHAVRCQSQVVRSHLADQQIG